MYHERQRLLHCAVHSLNNLFQERWVVPALLDDLARQQYQSEMELRQASGLPAPYFNAFKSPIGLGNYDISVIVAALALRGCRLSAHVVPGKNGDPEACRKKLEELDFAAADGLLVNRRGSIIWGQHWYVILPA
ncbi:unnamed protein product, partial [Phaeothamnion confervicola]